MEVGGSIDSAWVGLLMKGMLTSALFISRN